MGELPSYLLIPREKLGQGSGVTVRVVGDMQNLARDMASVMLEEIKLKTNSTWIIPVGPVDQFSILAQLINDERIDCSDLCLINMDEYLTDDDRWVASSHPLSFRGYMDRLFYDKLDPELAPPRKTGCSPSPVASARSRS
jgi:glucosamine-6-phosphate deaminase